MVYRLDAVDAYERKLVKQIEVASATVEDSHNRPFVRLVSTTNRRGAISARVEIDVEVAGTSSTPSKDRPGWRRPRTDNGAPGLC